MVIFGGCIISSGLPSSLEYFHRLAVCPLQSFRDGKSTLQTSELLLWTVKALWQASLNSSSVPKTENNVEEQKSPSCLIDSDFHRTTQGQKERSLHSGQMPHPTHIRPQRISIWSNFYKVLQQLSYGNASCQIINVSCGSQQASIYDAGRRVGLLVCLFVE